MMHCEAEAEGLRPASGRSDEAGAPTESNGYWVHEHVWLVRWVSLAYSFFWFIHPYYSHSARVWALFAVFYCVFLLAYFRIFYTFGRTQWMWLALLFVLGYLYYPFNHSAVGEFVYPIVLYAFMLPQGKLKEAVRRFLYVIGAQSLAMLLETFLLHLPMAYTENAIFYILVVGMSNFAYARQLLMGEQLKRANKEIEHLAQVAERERIARDLHDLLGHTLTVIVLKSDVANRVFETDPKMARREMAEVEATARKALAEVREAVAGYRAEGLPAEISQARRTLSSAGVQLTTNVEPVPLTERETNVLCLALREGITNVVRHARAATCQLVLRREGNSLYLLLEDDGQGIAGAEGNGLRGMRERFAAAGGSLSVTRSGESGGTRLRVELPLTRVPAEIAAAPAEGETLPRFLPGSGATVRA